MSNLKEGGEYFQTDLNDINLMSNLNQVGEYFQSGLGKENLIVE